MTRSDLDRLLPFGENTVPQKISNTVADWLNLSAIVLQAEAEDIAPTTEDRNEAEARVPPARSDVQEAARESIVTRAALSFSLGRWADEEVASSPPPAPVDYLCSNHILTTTEQEAQDALERVNGGDDFAELAKELSTGPSGAEGGDLGCGPRGRFVSAFEEAAYAASTGEVIGPVQTEFGWHIIEIESVGPATTENHPSADPAQIAATETRSRQDMASEAITLFEFEALDAWADSVTVDASIGVFDPVTFTIAAP